MRAIPSRSLRFYIASNPVLLRAWEMGRNTHEMMHEPQLSLDLAEHYVANNETPNTEILTFFLAMSALQNMDTEAAREALGDNVASIAQEVSMINVSEYSAGIERNVPISPITREVMACIVDYMNANIAQAHADALVAERTEAAVRRMHYALILQLAELAPGQKPN